MRRFAVWSVLIVCAFAVSASAQNKVVFDNQSGEPALVKLIGPTTTDVEVPNGCKAGTYANAGRYTIKVRYGTPGKYHYSKGEQFDVTETASQRSETTITLHKVVAGNYESQAISEADFGAASPDAQVSRPLPTAKPASTDAMPSMAAAVEAMNANHSTLSSQPSKGITAGVATDKVTRVGAGAILRRDGTVLKGQVLGTVVMAKGPMVAVIEGRDVLAIDEAGVRLRPDSVMVQAGMPLNTKADVFRNAKPEDVLKAALPAAVKMDAVKELDSSASLCMVLGGESDTPGFCWVTVNGVRAYVTKLFRSEVPELYILAGELRDDRGTINITATLRVQTGSGVESISVDSIVPRRSPAK